MMDKIPELLCSGTTPLGVCGEDPSTEKEFVVLAGDNIAYNARTGMYEFEEEKKEEIGNFGLAMRSGNIFHEQKWLHKGCKSLGKQQTGVVRLHPRMMELFDGVCQCAVLDPTQRPISVLAGGWRAIENSDFITPYVRAMPTSLHESPENKIAAAGDRDKDALRILRKWFSEEKTTIQAAHQIVLEASAYCAHLGDYSEGVVRVYTSHTPELEFSTSMVVDLNTLKEKFPLHELEDFINS